MSASRFCIGFGCACVAIAGLVAAWNAVVDPYLVFDAPRWTGFNGRKPAATTRERMIKAYDAPRHAARTLILGSSRSDLGMNPRQAVWPADAQPAYNLSIAGADTHANLRYLQHFVAEQPGDRVPRTVLVGLDFEYFLTEPTAAIVGAPVVGETEQRLAVLRDGQRNPERSWRVLKDRGAALLSLDALVDSIATVIASLRDRGPNIEPSGHLSEDVFRETVAADGVATLFAQKNLQTVGEYGTTRYVLQPTADGSVAGLDKIDALVEFAHAHRMKVVLFVQPAHADRLELLDRMGYWDAFEHWKIALTARVASSKANGRDVSLFDFGGYEDYSLETVPPDRDRTTRLRWFWEPAHYTTELGDLMLATLLGSADATAYGAELLPSNVAERLAQIRRDRLRFRSAHPDEPKRIEALYRSVVGATAVPR